MRMTACSQAEQATLGQCWHCVSLGRGWRHTRFHYSGHGGQMPRLACARDLHHDHALRVSGGHPGWLLDLCTVVGPIAWKDRRPWRVPRDILPCPHGDGSDLKKRCSAAAVLRVSYCWDSSKVRNQSAPSAPLKACCWTQNSSRLF